MRISSCLHPKVITNPYTGDVVTVPCGNCSVCHNKRAALWVQKLDEESRCHKYSLFVTLQYDEQNVPQVVRLRKEDTPLLSGQYDWSYIDCQTGQIISFSDPSVKRHNNSDKQYIFDTKILRVVSKRDCQLFIKKLRYYVDKLYKEQGKTDKSDSHLRYFLTAEYGGRTFRPHVHVILYFDSECIALHIEELLSKSWKYGNIYDPHFVNGSASEYVASYVNSFSKLPSIYQHVAIRQFSLFSKSPAIGTLQVLQSDIKQIFFEGLDKIRLFSQPRQKFIDIPLWRSLQDRCFPRIPRFACLDDSTKLRLYEFGNRFCDASTEEFVRWLRIFFVGRYASGSRSDELGKYFYDICHKPHFNRITRKIDFVYTPYSLFNFTRIVRRVCAQAASYNISVKCYVQKITVFYDKVSQSKFKEQIRFQDSYFARHPDESHGLFFDYAFLHRVNGKRVDVLSSTDRYILSSRLLIDDTTDIVNIDISDCFDYRDTQKLHDKIEFDNCKTKEMNDYILSKSNEFQNIINYYKNLDDI